MKIALYLSTDAPVKLPVHYTSQIQGMIYWSINNFGVRDYLHREGFLFEKRKFKLFTFSRLMAEKTKYDKNEKMLIMTPPFKLIICSPVSYLLQELATGILKQKQIRLGQVQLTVEEVSVGSTRVSEKKIRVRMLSPLTVYSTLPAPNGRKYTYYYSPFEDRFGELIRENLEKKRLLVYGPLDSESSLYVNPIDVKQSDFKVTRYRGFIVKGWLGEYELTGDTEMLQMALDAGLGSKNSQGYGCCALTDNA